MVLCDQETKVIFFRVGALSPEDLEFVGSESEESLEHV
jgi:hypothetical protein